MAEVKNVYEQLADVQQELETLKRQTTTLQAQMASDDPGLIEFVKNAKRIWRFDGGKSELRRHAAAIKKQGIMKLVLLFVQFLLPFFMISIPSSWFLVLFNGMICIFCMTYVSYDHFRKRVYEIPYDKWHVWGLRFDYDDNDIVCATPACAWLKLLQLFQGVSLIAIIVFSVYNFVYTGDWKAVVLMLIAFALTSCAPLRGLRGRGAMYSLHFVDEKNDFEYYLFKEFMNRHHLK